MTPLGLTTFQWAMLAYPVLSVLTFWGMSRLERDAAETRTQQDETERKVDLALGRLNQLAHHVIATDDTGPIDLLDAPTPAQQASPTRPDLEAQHPKVPHGATAVGRHRAPEVAA